VTASHREISLEAWQASPLAGLPPETRDALLSSSFLVRVPRGRLIVEPNGASLVALMHSGHVRVQWVTADGRSATIRYAGAGQVLGLPSVVVGWTPWSVCAVTECEMTVMSGSKLSEIAQRDAAVAWYLARQVTEIAFESIELLGGNIFEPVLQRLSRHLLELAERGEQGLVVTADQDELAHSIGSVREVIARALRTLREDGLVRRVGSALLITDPARLHEIAAGVRTAPASSV
jgi:CRP/FNR family transcriptional regulator, cyclic AMP receptor protein